MAYGYYREGGTTLPKTTSTGSAGGYAGYSSGQYPSYTPQYTGGYVPGYQPPTQYLPQYVPEMPAYSAGGGGGGGGYQPPKTEWGVGNWGVQTSNPLAPDWWQALQPQNMEMVNQPDVAYSLMLNTLIPFMSPEDQARMAEQMYGMWDTSVSGYRPMHRYKEKPFKVPYLKEYAQRMGLPEGTDPSYFLSGQRAQEALDALSAMREAMVGTERWKLGPGYRWLQSILETVKAYEGGNTRAQYVKMLGALDPLLGQASSGELAPFAPMAQAFIQPYFSTGPLVRAGRTASGAWNFGAANPLLRF